MSKRVKVYIASPYSNGNKEELTREHLKAAGYLLLLGFNPYAPLYSHYIQDINNELKTFPWLEVDKQWLDDCDILIRLHFKRENGEEIPSPGADEEEQHANQMGIPIFHFDTLEEMVRNMKTVTPTI